MWRVNPITKTDYPDPDIIRVDDTYYMLSTTMHFMPGGAILRSYDLVHWEIAGYLFEKGNQSPRSKLEGEQTNYGKGMWAGSLRYHEGMFYACFASPDRNQTLVFRAENIEGPWERNTLGRYLHEPSILFEDGRVFLAHGQSSIAITELLPDLSDFKEDGLNRVLFRDHDEVYLGYEGTHIYKINGKYYIFVIHWPKTGTSRRTQLVFRGDSLEDGEFEGRVVIDQDRDYHNQGVAQGGIVETPEGEWYGFFFQDHGAVGRIPILVPMEWEDGWPVFCKNGPIPLDVYISGTRPSYVYEPLYTSDNFKCVKNAEGKYQLKKQWQWNHEPKEELWRLREEGGLTIKSGKISSNITHAVNTLTQRMMWPRSAAKVTLDASELNDGDYAGLCALQGCYGFVGIYKNTGSYYLVVMTRELENTNVDMNAGDYLPGTLQEKILLPGPIVKLKITALFDEMQDKIEFSFATDQRFIRVGNRHKMYFRLDHFSGARYGLFLYSTQKCGGEATFTDFKYLYNEEKEN